MIIPFRFSKGEVLSADRLNQILDCLADLDARLDRETVVAGDGLVQDGNVISLADEFRGEEEIAPAPAEEAR